MLECIGHVAVNSYWGFSNFLSRCRMMYAISTHTESCLFNPILLHLCPTISYDVLPVSTGRLTKPMTWKSRTFDTASALPVVPTQARCWRAVTATISKADTRISSNITLHIPISTIGFQRTYTQQVDDDMCGIVGAEAPRCGRIGESAGVGGLVSLQRVAVRPGR